MVVIRQHTKSLDVAGPELVQAGVGRAEAAMPVCRDERFKLQLWKFEGEPVPQRAAVANAVVAVHGEDWEVGGGHRCAVTA